MTKLRVAIRGFANKSKTRSISPAYLEEEPNSIALLSVIPLYGKKCFENMEHFLRISYLSPVSIKRTKKKVSSKV